MARKKQELSRKTLARLEEEMRMYPKIPRLKAEALVTAELNRDTDVNWWIQGSRKKSEPPLDELMKKEGNKAYQYYDQLAKDIERTVSGLSPDLQKIIHECFWGMNSYYDWPTIGTVYLNISYRQIYSVRYGILEQFAMQRGITF
ncbi:transcriptional regulator [Lactococcus chungangensis]|uniref:transcriptional regulator n=1 Tax=Pseudolactococcus chungangensis TaxID=451457 RepID=UPI0037370E71